MISENEIYSTGEIPLGDLDINSNSDKLIILLSKKEGLSDLLENVLNQMLEDHIKEHLGADRYEHSTERQGYRNGYRASKPLY